MLRCACFLRSGSVRETAHIKDGRFERPLLIYFTVLSLSSHPLLLTRVTKYVKSSPKRPYLSVFADGISGNGMKFDLVTAAILVY